MKKLVRSVVVLALALVAAEANAFGFSKPKLPETGGGGATAADVDTFLGKATDADGLVTRAADALFSAVADKAQIVKYDQEMKAAEEKADPKEREAAVREAHQSREATLAGIDFEKAAKEKVALLDEAKKEKTGSAVYNLALGALVDMDLVAQGKKLVSGPPSPAIAGKLPEVKDALARLASQADGLGKVVSKAKALMSVVKLDALPTSAADAPKPISGD